MTQEQDQLRKNVEEVRMALLELHKMLIDKSRKDYESLYGEVANPWNFLQLLMTDPAFAWLHPFSQLITSVDELLESTLPMRILDGEAVRAMIENLLGDLPTTPKDFRAQYLAIIQKDAEIIVGHAKVKQKIVQLPQLDSKKIKELLNVKTQWTAANKVKKTRTTGNS